MGLHDVHVDAGGELHPEAGVAREVAGDRDDRAEGVRAPPDPRQVVMPEDELHVQRELPERGDPAPAAS